ncbi:helix-turn-helix domain-containing protein [Streptacidiphilus monticola]
MSSEAPRQAPSGGDPAPEPLWRDVVGGVLRRRRLEQGRTLREVAEAARISMPYLSEVERGRKEASSEVLAAAARALGLGLGQVLGLAQAELTARQARVTGRRPAAVPARGDAVLRTVSELTAVRQAAARAQARRDGLCLAA